MGTEFEPVITANDYFSLALRVLLGIAIVFELPTLSFFLSRMGILTARWMVKNFKYAVLFIFVIAAIITPTPDWMTQSIIAFPMLALYGLSILIALVFGKKKGKKEKEDTEDDLAG
jgi:sec-independent protein translocase protein TatC